ncbi:hypothetical protein ACH4TE_33910 [Streptomyces sioyaensis]|uniref:hypothetical protein n=1 Tax=Streptomyces sioyaensis TaxID=67364 RepID=UPI0037BD3793
MDRPKTVKDGTQPACCCRSAPSWPPLCAPSPAARAPAPTPSARSSPASLAAGLTTASAAFDAHMPELFAGHDADTDPLPVPYPAACRRPPAAPRPGRREPRF